MAELLVSAFVGTLIGNLSSAVLQEIGLVWGLEGELQRLESIFTTIQLVLQDAEVKQRNNEVLQNWLRKLKNTAYDAEDVLDQIATEGLRRRSNSERGKHGHHLTSFFSKRNPLLFRIKISHQVKDVRERLDAIADERLRFHLREGIVNNRFGDVESRLTSSLVNESEIFGRVEEREMIVEKLLYKMSDRDDLSACAIWGMGGIGKTTLAQLVYNDERVEKHFELRIWVCVSEDFSLQRLVRAILESIQGGGCSVTELDPLMRLLQEKLRGKKFLLVLDDVWNENQSLWDQLKEALKCGSKGSGVMITTRIEKIALMMATITSHHIGYLSDTDSWSLFKKRAFACRKEEENLLRIGEAIVKKCGGVPLAIKALGSLMQFKSHDSEWLDIKASEIWNLSDHENSIFPILRLSYDNLSPQMRQCFAYCCIFPKDCLMDRDQLIQLWMANGFLHVEGRTDMHVVGQLIFKELVWRSFLQDVQKHHKGTMRCKMHDLMHDLAESVMRNETYILGHDKVLKYPLTVRHFSCDLESFWRIKENKDNLKLPRSDTLRSLILHNRIPSGFAESFSSFLSNQRHLRVLDLSGCGIENLPNFIRKWENLRFLSMSCDHITRLPESITCLHNLQSLKLTDTCDLLELPKGLKYMKNLWFVEIESHHSLICTPPGLGELTTLQRLSIFIVGHDSEHQINQLMQLNLGGKLSIRGLENVRNLEDARSANMITKKNLTSLSLSWTSGTNKNSVEHFEETLEGIQPHQNTKKIHILSYQGSSFPNWMSNSAFTNLSKITLESCGRCEHLPPLGKLPALKILQLFGLDSVRRFYAEWHGEGESSFPALTSLSIAKMPRLEEWIPPNSHDSFLCLQHLSVYECPKLIRLPLLPALVDLETDINPAFLQSMMLTSLQSLSLSCHADEISLPPDGLQGAEKNLKYLDVECPSLSSLSTMLSDLYALKHLIFDRFQNLEYPPEGLKYLNSIETIYFEDCDNLRLFPANILENLSSLRTLWFQGCQKLDPLSGPLRKVSNLHDLLINGCRELKCLPESIQQLTALRKLKIGNCEGLCSLPNWIGNLKSLSTFGISNCGLKSLPEGFRNLTSLCELHIETSDPELMKRCEKSKGEDWSKISHIPQIIVGNFHYSTHV